MAFAIFFLAEYANMILISVLASIMFFGGWDAPISQLSFIPGWIWLGIKTFGLIANDPIDELKYSKIQVITPENYNNIRCREREGMKKLKVEQVFNKIMEGLN